MLHEAAGMNLPEVRMRVLKRRRDPAAVNSRLIRRPIQRMFWLFLLPMTVMLLKVLNDDGVIHIFKVPPEEAAEFKAAKDKDEKTDAERKAKKREGIKKIKTGKKK